jgi:hypothetical protein
MMGWPGQYVLDANEEALRATIVREMGDALAGVALEHPNADGAKSLRLCLAYLAQCHANAFGHVETVKALVEISRRGIAFAAQQSTAACAPECAGSPAK